MYLDQSLREYLNDLSSSQPTPGGGSAAALSGAMGAALASMVTRLTIGKSGYADVQDEIEDILQKTEELRERFQQLIQEDSDAYERLAMSFRLPKGNAEENEARSRVIQVRLHEAALVPLEVAERAAELMRFCVRLAQIGNKNVRSDIAAGAALVVSAAQGAAWMVRVNLRSLRNQQLVEQLQGRLETALLQVETGHADVVRLVGGTL
ncbi:methenyltetrahydrofolate cyclohydrolase [Thermogemmatispora aurantia]|uniref:Methenyltetrahydrofolate cyclohydrolase n=1 Tax=Thermogemmatispora aurantia TaxID=2045279 RepID=A0A5J4K8B4_9CHLR|nr:cyclodeaminase/cyclohydrolase family protein [Thermogemmatispora aurantia]GER82897.1 methenyltetrahydrofolate cyclohydrolase [Thermogemmatispora aurantia]